MDPRVASILKFALLALVTVVLGGYVMKHVRLKKKIDKLAAEMRTLVSDTSFYKAPTVDAAQSTLFKGIALMYDAKALGLEPSDYMNEVFPHEKKDKVGMDDEFEEHPAREKLARDTYQRGYQMAQQFNLLDSPEKVQALRDGRMPDVKPKPVVACIIDPTLSPGMEKIVPNLDLRPAGTKLDAPPTDMEVAAAKGLCSDLYSARVIESDADSRISKHYDRRPKKDDDKPETKPEVKPAPKAEPKPEPKAEEPKPAEPAPTEEPAKAGA